MMNNAFCLSTHWCLDKVLVREPSALFLLRATIGSYAFSFYFFILLFCIVFTTLRTLNTVHRESQTSFFFFDEVSKKWNSHKTFYFCGLRGNNIDMHIKGGFLIRMQRLMPNFHSQIIFMFMYSCLGLKKKVGSKVLCVTFTFS